MHVEGILICIDVAIYVEYALLPSNYYTSIITMSSA